MLKAIKGFETSYFVSSDGKVFNRNGREIKPYLHTRGYLKVDLWDKQKRKKLFVHRLVAEAFLPNPNGYPQINHKDEDKTNNAVENLEWCTNRYNMNYGKQTERGKKVVQCSKTGEPIAVWNSISAAARAVGRSVSSVTLCCQGKRNYCGGYRWEYST